MALRLVLCIEATARQRPLWDTLSRGVLEPLLGMLQALQRVELALVLFGAHPPHSVAAVQSSGWLADVPALRRLLDGVQLSGGARQPVALAEALAEAAALFALQQGGAVNGSGGDPPPQQHCLVCIASDPAAHPVAWPYLEDSCLAQLPDLATSAELSRALRRHGVQLGWASGTSLLHSPPLLWHVANLMSEAPISLAESRADLLRSKRGDLLRRVLQAALTLAGGGMVVLPSWQQATEALQKAGAKPVQPSADQAHTAESGNPPSAVKQENGAAGHGTAAAPAAAPAAAAALPPSGPSPVMPQQWTPPGAAATPTSFLDILNAEITSPEQADPAWQVPAAALQQPLAGSAGPAVQGLPLPPGAAQQVQAAGMGSGGMSASSTAMSTAPSGGGGGANYALIHSAQVVLDGKVTGSGPLLLGVGQVLGMVQDAATLRMLAWPPELRVVKTTTRGVASSFLAGKSCWHTRLKLQSASADAQRFPESLLSRGGAAVVQLYGNLMGVLLPARHPETQQVLLQLVVVPGQA